MDKNKLKDMSMDEKKALFCQIFKDIKGKQKEFEIEKPDMDKLRSLGFNNKNKY
jgi:hypothetical protein